MRKLKHNTSGTIYLVSDHPVWTENLWMCGSSNFIDTTGTEFSVVDWISDDELAEIAADAAQKDTEQAASVRTSRTEKLKDCDWTQISDSTADKAAWATYRQSLRDITKQAGFPWTVEWPVQP